MIGLLFLHYHELLENPLIEKSAWKTLARLKKNVDFSAYFQMYPKERCKDIYHKAILPQEEDIFVQDKPQRGKPQRSYVQMRFPAFTSSIKHRIKIHIFRYVKANPRKYDPKNYNKKWEKKISNEIDVKFEGTKFKSLEEVWENLLESDILKEWIPIIRDDIVELDKERNIFAIKGGFPNDSKLEELNKELQGRGLKKGDSIIVSGFYLGVCVAYVCRYLHNKGYNVILSLSLTDFPYYATHIVTSLFSWVFVNEHNVDLSVDAMYDRETKIMLNRFEKYKRKWDRGGLSKIYLTKKLGQDIENSYKAWKVKDVFDKWKSIDSKADIDEYISWLDKFYDFYLVDVLDSVLHELDIRLINMKENDFIEHIKKLKGP